MYSQGAQLRKRNIFILYYISTCSLSDIYLYLLMRLWTVKLLYNAICSIHITEWSCKSTMQQMIADKEVLTKLKVEKCWYDFTLFGTTVRFLHSKDKQKVVLSAHEAKLLICLMGAYWFVDDEYTFDLTHTERLVVLVKGDHFRRGHCFSKKKVLERTNGVKQWHGWRMQLQDRIKSG